MRTDQVTPALIRGMRHHRTRKKAMEVMSKIEVRGDKGTKVKSTPSGNKGERRGEVKGGIG